MTINKPVKDRSLFFFHNNDADVQPYSNRLEEIFSKMSCIMIVNEMRSFFNSK